MTNYPNTINRSPPFVEHHVPRGPGSLYARDYGGAGPAFVLMHGFPDNLHIYDNLIPFLTASGRRVVAFDFLGFGASDKADGVAYDFEQQVGDLESITESLGLETIVPVAHDSSGIVSLNYALAHPGKVAAVIMLNSAYADGDTVLWPELITLFATASLRELAMAVAQSPEQFGWLLTWQQSMFMKAMPDSLKSQMETIIGPLIAKNFIVQPSSGPAFVQLAAQFYEVQARNTGRLADLKELDIPVKLIWGQYDPYITVAVAKHRQTQLKHSTLTIIPAGHWLQVDMPEMVAKAILS